jgi:hypothetical protein
MKHMKTAFNCNQRLAGMKVRPRTGNQPPMNKTANRVDIKKMLLYSPKKNIAKMMLEYSRLYPATISASASGRSKGALLVSAMMVTKKIAAIGHIRMPYQPEISWAKTTSVRFRECAQSATIQKTKPIDTSYETICAALLNAPKNGYLELETQPARMIP